MITLSADNVEKIIFYDKKAQQILPELSQVFAKWVLGVRTGINSIAKDALLDFLNSVTTEHLDRLGSYLRSPVSVRKIDPRLVKHFETDVYCLKGELENMSGFQGNVTVAREGDLIYLSMWR